MSMPYCQSIVPPAGIEIYGTARFALLTIASFYVSTSPLSTEQTLTCAEFNNHPVEFTVNLATD